MCAKYPVGGFVSKNFNETVGVVVCFGSRIG